MHSSRILAMLAAWRPRLAAATGSPLAKRSASWIRRGITAAIVLGITWQLTQVGWLTIVSSLPTNPGFYLLLGFIYLSLPLFEVPIYTMLWGTRAADTFRACALKRVYNDDLVGYSGEVFFYLWATEQGVGRGDAFRAVRDVNIVSSMTSVLVAAALVAAMVSSGQINPTAWIGGGDWIYWATGAGVAAVLLALAVVFRRHVFALPLRTALKVFGIHLSRLAAAHAAMIWMWSIAVPDVPLAVWLTFVTVLIVMNRLPFLPSKDLLFVGAGVGLSRTMAVATAAIAGVLLIQSVTTRVLNLAVLMAARLAKKRSEREPVAA